MKKLVFVTLLSFFSLYAFSNHLKGGFFTYQYLGPGTDPTKLRYHVQLTVYMVCHPTPGQLTPTIPFTFFDAGTHSMVDNRSASILQQYELGKVKDEDCVSGDQRGCYYYIVIYDLPSIELPANAAGYIISYQRCCRIIGIDNITGNSSNVGNTYSIKIPGSSAGQNAQHNSSAVFQINDTAVVCKNSFFQLPFLANDPDSDSLSYYFCDAWTGGGQQMAPANGPNSATPDPAAAPTSFSPLQYPVIPYASGFTGSSPLGNTVTINSATGLISGIAPAAGEYVITVCVNEYRNGVLIAGTRKELHIIVGDCGAIKATLDPAYISCDGFTLTFSNNTPSGITSYFWDFGVAVQTNDTSNIATPTFTYPDTGTYVLKLVVNRGQPCSDSTTALVKVYPGFFPGFITTGVCVSKPIQFIDTTTTRYGRVDTWNWNFGDLSTFSDTSHLQNPTYTYAAAGIKNVTFIVTNSKGCIDTVSKDIEILTKPPLRIATKDTLICNGDSVQLHAIGNGIFSWTPLTNIINPNTPDPVVYPATTTSYEVLLDDQGCQNRDTARVRVVNTVTLTAMADTLICSGDTLRLYAATDGLRFLWDNPATLNNPTLLTPLAKPVANPTLYHITAFIGHCAATDDVLVTQVPYPIARAGNDTTICFNTAAQLNGSIVGSSFVWSPISTLTNAATLTPTATPKRTTAYVLSAYDTLGCPKPGRDTVMVKVNAEVIAFAGRDTAVVIGQPLQFNGSGGVSYLWSPPVGLSNTTIPNPKGFYDGSFDSIRYTLVVRDSIGCADDATVLVKIFKTAPSIFVPTAFSPNGDGRNDVVRPIAVGITKIEYFRIYNRWGQLVFETTVNGKGWDGKIAGTEQGTNTFVWIVRAVDYTGKALFAKGNVTLIR